MKKKDGYFERIPDQIIVNKYYTKQGIAKHIDRLPCFDDTIASLSLGDPVVMDFMQILMPKSASKFFFSHVVWLFWKVRHVTSGCTVFEHELTTSMLAKNTHWNAEYCWHLGVWFWMTKDKQEPSEIMDIFIFHYFP